MPLPCLKPSNCFCVTPWEKRWVNNGKQKNSFLWLMNPSGSGACHCSPSLCARLLSIPQIYSVCVSQGPCTCCSLCLNAFAPGFQMTCHLLSFRSSHKVTSPEIFSWCPPSSVTYNNAICVFKLSTAWSWLILFSCHAFNLVSNYRI